MERTAMNYDAEALRANRNTVGMGPSSEALLSSAEQRLGKPLPSLIRAWCRDFGCISLRPEHDAFLILLGMGTSADDDIVLFNAGNQRVPTDALIFAHEFTGRSDIIYLVTDDGAVFQTTDARVFPYINSQLPAAAITWVPAYESLEAFWQQKVPEYLV